MPRRSLRKLADSPDWSGYLLTDAQLPQPWNTAHLFGHGDELVIEVGSGKGMFLLSAAAAYPHQRFLGIEIAGKYAEYVAARLAQRELTNARMLRGDATRLFADVLPDNEVAEVHVYFPDPWWKKRHRRRRLMNDGFLQHVERTLRPGGRLHFWTDVADYFLVTLERLAAATRLQGPFEVPEVPAWHDMDFRTHFERRVRLNELPVYRAEFCKPGWSTELGTVNGALGG